jgi:hypothetical protein
MDGGSKPLPRAGALLQRRQTGGSEDVDLPLAASLVPAPLALHQALSLQGVKGRVERPFLAGERRPAAPLDFPRDPIAMERTIPEDGHHQGGGIPFQQLALGVHGSGLPLGTVYLGIRGL